MQRIIGVMPIWAREPFVEPALRQSIRLCDSVAVTVKCMHPALDQFEDNSEEIARAWSARASASSFDISYVPTEVDESRIWSDNMAYVLNQLLEAAKPKEGDLVWLLDCDEFYPAAALTEIHDHLRENEIKSLRFRSRFIGPDMDHYVLHGHTRLHRYWEGRRFVPTSMMQDQNEDVILLEDNPMFHYSLFVDPAYKPAFWDIEFGQGLQKQKTKTQWWNEVYLHYDPEDEERWMARNEEITGHHGFWFSDSCEEADPNGGVFTLKNRPHPKSIREAGLQEKLYDMRAGGRRQAAKPVFQGGPEKGVQMPSEPKRDREGLPPSQERKITLRMNGEAQAESVLFGPWGGELGYELMLWVPTIRAVSRQFRHVTVVFPKGHDPFYQDFADQFVGHGVDLGEHRWKANSGDVKFWTGGWERLLEGEEEEKVRQLATEMQKVGAGQTVIEPNPTLWRVPPEHISLYREQDNEGLSPQVLLHCRRAGAGRDWPSGKFDALCEGINDLGFRPGIVGTTSDYLPRGSCVDLRSDPRSPMDTNRLIGLMSGAELIVGGSSGVMHLASLCELPHIVWGDPNFPIPEIGRSVDAYEKRWNPFDTPVLYLKTGWDPDVEEVLEPVKVALGPRTSAPNQRR